MGPIEGRPGFVSDTTKERSPYAQVTTQNNKKGQNSMFPIKPTSPMDVFSNENYLDEPQDTEFKRTIINFSDDFKDFKEDTKKQYNDIGDKDIK